MQLYRNNIIDGLHGKPILLDVGYRSTGAKKPVVIFAHGFKGFKDWGHFNKMMEHFISHDFVFVKFNFSHNGGTPEQPIDFPDLEAFGNNNYTKELDDLRTVVDWVHANELIHSDEINHDEIYLTGHSRGGGVSILATKEDQRIKKLATWAAVSDLINRFPEEAVELWKKNGVMYIENSRTNQQMPLYYQLAEDTLANRDRFCIQTASSEIKVPHLLVHGRQDVVVTLAEAEQIGKWNPNAEMLIIEEGDHVFGSRHPFDETEFPNHLQLVLDKTIEFFKK